jgi:hypothetical protein
MVFDDKILKLLTGFFKTILKEDNIKTGLGLYSPLLVGPGDLGSRFLAMSFFEG